MTRKERAARDGERSTVLRRVSRWCPGGIRLSRARARTDIYVLGKQCLRIGASPASRRRFCSKRIHTVLRLTFENKHVYTGLLGSDERRTYLADGFCRRTVSVVLYLRCVCAEKRKLGGGEQRIIALLSLSLTPAGRVLFVRTDCARCLYKRVGKSQHHRRTSNANAINSRFGTAENADSPAVHALYVNKPGRRGTKQTRRVPF